MRKKIQNTKCPPKIFCFKFSETKYFHLHLIKNGRLPLRESPQIRRNFGELCPVGHDLNRKAYIVVTPAIGTAMIFGDGTYPEISSIGYLWFFVLKCPSGTPSIGGILL